jgi:hypothetical protein
MRNRQHTLLAGVATLALFVASGMAFAQQNQQEQKGAAQSNMQSQHGAQATKNKAASQGVKNQGAQQGKNQSAKNQSAKNQSAMSKQSSGQNARKESKMQSKQTGAAADMTGKSNAGKGEKSANRSTQQLKQNKGASTAKTTQSKTGQFANQPQLQGLQGSTRAPMQGATTNERVGGAANVSLNEQQRTQIRETVINSRSAPRVSNVDFSVNVGTAVPRGHIHLVRVPETLIRIEPRWRHYLYFVFNNEIVIVEPRTMRIVQVLPV